MKLHPATRLLAAGLVFTLFFSNSSHAGLSDEEIRPTFLFTQETADTLPASALLLTTTPSINLAYGFSQNFEGRADLRVYGDSRDRFPSFLIQTTWKYRFLNIGNLRVAALGALGMAAFGGYSPDTVIGIPITYKAGPVNISLSLSYWFNYLSYLKKDLGISLNLHRVWDLVGEASFYSREGNLWSLYRFGFFFKPYSFVTIPVTLVNVYNPGDPGTYYGVLNVEARVGIQL